MASLRLQSQIERMLASPGANTDLAARHRSGWLLVHKWRIVDLRHDVVLAQAPASIKWVRTLRLTLVLAVLAIVTASCGSATTDDEVSPGVRTGRIGEVGDLLELHLGVRWLPGAFDPLQMASNAWKQGPRIDAVVVRHHQPSLVLEHAEWR